MPKQGGVNTLSVKNAALLLGKGEMWIRFGIREGRLTYGEAFKTETGIYSYTIYKSKFAKTLGLTVQELDRQLEELQSVRIRNEFCCL